MIKKKIRINLRIENAFVSILMHYKKIKERQTIVSLIYIL